MPIFLTFSGQARCFRQKVRAVHDVVLGIVSHVIYTLQLQAPIALGAGKIFALEKKETVIKMSWTQKSWMVILIMP